MFKIYGNDNRESFYQWDFEQRLIVEDDSIIEVHFCNRTDDCSLVCEVYAIPEEQIRVVDVPNILLQNSWDIRVYAFETNHTKVEERFKVIPRTKPGDYVYTETEVKNYEERIKALEEGAGGVGRVTENNGEIFNDYENNIAAGPYSHVEGEGNSAAGEGAHVEGRFNVVNGNGTHAEGRDNQVTGGYSHAEGYGNIVNADRAHAEGGETKCNGYASHTEGTGTQTNASYAHAEGFGSKANGEATHAEGKNTTASGIAAHSEGELTTASGNYSHAEGYRNTAIAECTHAEGYAGKASAFCAHSEGNGNEASGNSSHAEGYHTKASGFASHAGGKGTIAKYDSQTVIGKYNAESSGLFVIGNGEENNKSNVFEVHPNGTLVIAGMTITPNTLFALLRLLDE